MINSAKWLTNNPSVPLYPYNAMDNRTNHPGKWWCYDVRNKLPYIKRIQSNKVPAARNFTADAEHYVK